MLLDKNLTKYDLAWLDLELDAVEEYLRTSDGYNPFDDKLQVELENKGLREIFLMYDPNYLWYTVKLLLNIELHPIQAVVLGQMMTHSFPMLIGSRGFSKSFLMAVYSLIRAILFPGSKIVITGAAFRQSKFVFEYVENMFYNSPILQSIYKGTRPSARLPDFWTFHLNESKIFALPTGCLTEDTLVTTENGIRFINKLSNIDKLVWSINKFKEIGFKHNNGIKPTRKLVTNLGIKIQGTLDHKIKVVENNHIVWKELGDIQTGDRVVLDYSKRWFAPSFKCTADEAYALGAMIGDGSYRKKYQLKFTTKDSDIVQYLNNGIGQFKTYDNLNYFYNSVDGINKWLSFWQLEQHLHDNKYLPDTILSASQESMKACLQGLFDTDGTVSHRFVKGGLHSQIGFTTTSQILAQQIQYILSHFGIVSSLYERHRKPSRIFNRENITYPKPSFDIQINGQNIIKFYHEIGFRCVRKQAKLQFIINNKKHNYYQNYDVPISKDILLNISKKYKFKYRFSVNRMKYKKKICPDYLNKFYYHCLQNNVSDTDLQNIIELNNPNYYYATVKDINNDLCLSTYDINVPEDNTYIANGFITHNTGEKIRGMRGNIIICDEFNSISTEVYEIVISQFAAVSSSPIENIKAIAKKLAQQKDGIVEEEHKALSFVQNQSIISGTMKYQFEPMAIYWQKYKAIIESRGERMVELFGELGDSLDWRDFCIIRIPFELIPKGFMDDKIVARARSTMHSEFYAAEYGCVPISDSMGFFKRSLIESCTAKLENTTKDNWPTWCSSPFDCKLQGNPNAKYVMGIDPAYNQDNFAIVILEVLEEHSRIVYAWSTSKRTFNKSGPVDEKNYFNFCARKIRDLMKSFNIVGIAIDTQGGGYSILECLHDPDKMQSGEIPLWPIIDPDKPQDTDDYAGSHIITLCQFSSADWVSTNNHGMKKDMEDKVLLFPQFNSVLLGLASEKDKEELLALGLVRDSLEDCMVEIEELKDELCLIVRTTTVAGRERFDTPSIIVGSNKKEQLRKDRYSALLIANSIARTIQRSPAPISYQVVGAAKGTTNKSDGKMYFGPDWVSNISSKSFRGITRQ